MAWHTTEAEGISVALDREAGHIAALAIAGGDRVLNPLHRAPWIDEPGLDPALPVHLRHLSGDFFCAPFGASDVEPAPAHGWSANAPWQLVAEQSAGGRHLSRYALERPILGARLEKELMVIDGHPFLYQRHILHGGSGAVPVGHHTVVHAEAGGRLAVSPKRLAMTPTDWPEPRRVLAYPARSADFHSFPAGDAAMRDLGRVPLASRNEDFVMLVEAGREGLGWSAFRRRAEEDVVLVLKPAETLPATMLWYSNGGRNEPPWSGRHIGVLGIEDCRAFSLCGHRASIAENELSRAGIPMALALSPDAAVSVTHAIGALPLVWADAPVVEIHTEGGALRIGTEDGLSAEVLFAAELLDPDMEGQAWRL